LTRPRLDYGVVAKMICRYTAVICCLTIPAVGASSSIHEDEFAEIDFEAIGHEFNLFDERDWAAGSRPSMHGITHIAAETDDWFMYEPRHASVPVSEFPDPAFSSSFTIPTSFVKDIEPGHETSRKRRAASELIESLEQLSKAVKVDRSDGVGHIRKQYEKIPIPADSMKMVRPIIELAVVPVWFYTAIANSFTRGLDMSIFRNRELAEILVLRAIEGIKHLKNPTIFREKWIYDFQFIQRVIDVWVQYCFEPMKQPGASQEEQCKLKRRFNTVTDQFEEVWALSGTGLREFLLKAVDEVKLLASLKHS